MSRLWKWENETGWSWILMLAGAAMVLAAFLGVLLAEPDREPAETWTPATSSVLVPTEVEP